MGFQKQITLWKNKAQNGNLEKIAIDHFHTLEKRLIHYFLKLNIQKFGSAPNPFLITDISVFYVSLNQVEELIVFYNNRYLIKISEI